MAAARGRPAAVLAGARSVRCGPAPRRRRRRRRRRARARTRRRRRVVRGRRPRLRADRDDPGRGLRGLPHAPRRDHRGEGGSRGGGRSRRHRGIDRGRRVGRPVRPPRHPRLLRGRRVRRSRNPAPTSPDRAAAAEPGSGSRPGARGGSAAGRNSTTGRDTGARSRGAGPGPDRCARAVAGRRSCSRACPGCGRRLDPGSGVEPCNGIEHGGGGEHGSGIEDGLGPSDAGRCRPGAGARAGDGARDRAGARPVGDRKRGPRRDGCASHGSWRELAFPVWLPSRARRSVDDGGRDERASQRRLGGRSAAGRRWSRPGCAGWSQATTAHGGRSSALGRSLRRSCGAWATPDCRGSCGGSDCVAATNGRSEGAWHRCSRRRRGACGGGRGYGRRLTRLAPGAHRRRRRCGRRRCRGRRRGAAGAPP